MKKTVVITGVSGFVGQSLSAYLTPNYDIKGVYRDKNELTFKTITEQDFNDTEAVIHLAGKAHDLKNTSEAEDYFKINTELTKQIFDLFLKSSSKVFIFLSTLKAVADTSDIELNEETIANPISPYGKSKLLAEQYILSKDIPKDKSVYILRPSMIYGKNNKGNLALLNAFILKGIPYPFKKYINLRSFLYVENLNFIIDNLIENKDIDSGIYHVTDDHPISTLTLVKYIAEIQNKKLFTPNIPKLMVKILARIGDVLALPINSERLEKLTENYYSSNQKIKKALGKELPYNTLQGLKNSFKK